MRIRVNAVMVMSIAGRSVNTVITISIWIPRAYSVFPLGIGVEVTSGIVCASAMAEATIKTRKSKARAIITY